MAFDPHLQHVADAKVNYKHLTGGVELIDAIPKNPSGKIVSMNAFVGPLAHLNVLQLRRLLRAKAKESRPRISARL